MKSVESIIRPIGEALAGIEGLSVYHYWRPQLPAPFCIWAEESDTSFEADNVRAEFGITGAVSFYTKIEFDPYVDLINNALNATGAVWSYGPVMYEDETGLIHHEWSWTAI